MRKFNNILKKTDYDSFRHNFLSPIFPLLHSIYFNIKSDRISWHEDLNWCSKKENSIIAIISIVFLLMELIIFFLNYLIRLWCRFYKNLELVIY